MYAITAKTTTQTSACTGRAVQVSSKLGGHTILALFSEAPLETLIGKSTGILFTKSKCNGIEVDSEELELVVAGVVFELQHQNCTV